MLPYATAVTRPQDVTAFQQSVQTNAAPVNMSQRQRTKVNRSQSTCLELQHSKLDLMQDQQVLGQHVQQELCL